MPSRSQSKVSLSLAAALAMSASAIASENNGAGQGDPMSLYLRAGTVDTQRPVLDLGAVIASRPTADRRFVIQLDGPITPQRRARLAAAGIGVGDYLPSNAYIATLDRADARAAAGLDFIRWVGEFQTGWKLDPELGQRVYASTERVGLQA